MEKVCVISWSTFHLKKKLHSLLRFITRKFELWIFHTNHFTTAKPFKNSFADQIFSLENTYLLDILPLLYCHEEKYTTTIFLSRNK